MNNTYKLLALATALVVGLSLVPMTAGQNTAFVYGSQVAQGDDDFIPSLIAAPAPTVCRINFGDPTSALDDGYYFHFGGGPALINGDVRLVGVLGKTAGSIITDADVTEKSGALVGACIAVVIGNIDVNGNGLYGSEDYSFVDTGANAAGIFPAAAPCAAALAGLTACDIRLTVTSGGAAGTLTIAGNSDVTAFGGAFPAFGPGALRMWNADLSAGGSWTPGDNLYLHSAPVAALPKVHDVRLVSYAGAFGSRVGPGGQDFIPVFSPAGMAAPCLGRLNFGDPTSALDDGYYLDFSGAAPLGNGDVRLVGILGKTAGSIITDADVTEKSVAAYATGCIAVGFQFVDVDGGGEFNAGDYVYVDTGAVAFNGGAAGLGAFDIRLTTTSGGAAGTIAIAGNSDITAYGGALAVAPLAVGAGAACPPFLGGQTVCGPNLLSYWDADLSATYTPGDGLYLETGALAGLPKIHDLRVVSTNGAFGSSVALGNADFIQTIANIAVPPVVCRINFGDPTSALDDGYYLDYSPAGAPAAGLANGDIRLVGVLGKTAGSIITDADVTEKSGAPVCIALALITVDVNGNGLFGNGDYVFIDTGATGAGLFAATPCAGAGAGGALSACDLRLTMTSGGAAGTIAIAANSDIVAFGGAAVGAFPNPAAGIDFWDSDLDGVYSPGDHLYLSNNALPGGGLPIIHDVRIVGVHGISGNPQVTPSPSPSVSPSPSPSPSPTPTQPQPTQPQPTGNDEEDEPETPGFELVALLGALAVALVLVRRKL